MKTILQAKEDHAAYMRGWREAHPGYSSPYSRRWALANPEADRASKDKWNRLNPDKIRNKTLLRKYGITLDQSAVLLDEQGGTCAICHQLKTKRNGMNGMVVPLAVDHDHATGRIRGLLCHNCKVAIGLMNSNLGRLATAIAYLGTEE